MIKSLLFARKKVHWNWITFDSNSNIIFYVFVKQWIRKNKIIIIFHRQNIKKCYKCVLKISLLLAPKIKLFSEQCFFMLSFFLVFLKIQRKKEHSMRKTKTQYCNTHRVVWDGQMGLVEIETNPFHWRPTEVIKKKNERTRENGTHSIQFNQLSKS